MVNNSNKNSDDTKTSVDYLNVRNLILDRMKDL